MAKVAKVSVTGVDMDSAVLDLLKKVQVKKEEIKKAKTRPSWKTNCVFPLPGGVVHIQTVSTTTKLIELQAYLNQQESAMKQAAEELEVEFDGTLCSGFSFDDWREDIKSRANQLLLNKKESELKELDERVNKLVSPDQRREMELKALMEILK